MNIILYRNFNKKKNSTKRPDAGGISADVKLKSGCSTQSPIFLINGVDLAVNYVFWNDYYYFIDEIILGNNNIYELHCSMDVLASWRGTIGNYTAFIERSASAYDVMVNDPYITPTQDIRNYSAASTMVGTLFYGSGCFLIQVMSQDGITLYASESLEPWGIIFNPSSYTMSDIAAWIDSKISQAFDLDVYIGSVKWLPMNASLLDDGSGVIGTLAIGPLHVTVPTTAGKRTYKCSDRLSREANITKISLPTSGLPYTDFRLCTNKFTQWSGYFPGVGTVDLDSSIFGEAAITDRSIACDVQFDLVSGNICYNLTHGSNNARIAEFNGNASVDVPIGKASYNTSMQLGTFASGIAGVAASVATQNYIGAAAGAVGTVMTMADNAVNPQTSILSGGGGNKGELARHGSIIISYKTYGSRDIPLSSYGRPLYGWRQISTLSGFVKCNAASIDISGMGPEKDQVNMYLNSGFYYE